MRLVGDDGKPLAFGGREFADFFERERKCLDRANDDLLARCERLRKLPAFARALRFDRCDHAGGALEVEQRVLELLIDHVTVGDDDDCVEQLFVFGVVKVREEMRRPRDRVGLAGTRRVLDEELAARALFENLRLQLACSVELVIARENDAFYLFLLIARGDKITANDLQPAIALPHLFPKIACAVTVVD